MFFTSTNLIYSGSPGDLLLQYSDYFIGSVPYGMSVYSADIDADGDMDVLSAGSGLIEWWENDVGSGTDWTAHLVVEGFAQAQTVLSRDIDGDGDMDVIGAALQDEEITWWENTDGCGQTWTTHLICDNIDWVSTVHSEDIDGDGDMDVIGPFGMANTIRWWENLDGSGTSWQGHGLNTSYIQWVRSIHSEDVDGDGDKDIVTAAANILLWYENSNGSGTSWTEHSLAVSFGSQSVHTADIDGDGDIDIVGGGNGILWCENEDGSGEFWSYHSIDDEFHAYDILSIDIDDDGDMDILGAGDDRIALWINADGLGNSWIKCIIDNSFAWARSVYSEDINGDGNTDVLGITRIDAEIAWWDLNEYSTSGVLESSILEIPCDPSWDYLNWESDEPSGTSVSFQVRASDDHTNMGVWSDTLFDPSTLEGVLFDEDSYLQYRAILHTTDSALTPVLNSVAISWDPVSLESSAELVHPASALLPVSPNPSTTPMIRFNLLEEGIVEIAIFNIAGRVVDTLDEYYPVGYSMMVLESLPPGVYLCRMSTGDFADWQRFVVME
jgi:hypothetical protein